MDQTICVHSQTSFKAICDIARHENTIIGNINEIVGHDDELWILGDLSYRCTVEHTLECLRRINCRHLHLIIGNHDRNFRLRFNDMLYEDVFETIDDYCEIDMELPVLDESGKITVATTQQSIAMSHFPRLSALAEEHGDWPSNWNEFADMAPTTDRLAALRSCGSAPPNRIADGLSDSITRFSQ